MKAFVVSYTNSDGNRCTIQFPGATPEEAVAKAREQEKAWAEEDGSAFSFTEVRTETVEEKRS
jgi:hypothetical protein